MRSHTTQAHYQLPTALVGKYVLAVDMTARILATGSAHAHWSAQCPELVVGLNASIQLVAPDSGRKLAVMMDEEAEICTFCHPLITALATGQEWIHRDVHLLASVCASARSLGVCHMTAPGHMERA